MSDLSPYINRAAQQGAPIQSFADDLVQISGSFAEFVTLWHATCEVFKTFSGTSSRQSFIGSIQPDGHNEEEKTLTLQQYWRETAALPNAVKIYTSLL